VQRATEDLITERDHLSAETQGAGQAKTPANSPVNSPVNAATPPPGKKPPAAQAQAAATGGTNGAAAGNLQDAAPEGPQSAGAETKP
jgi:hypothetical protein